VERSPIMERSPINSINSNGKVFTKIPNGKVN